MLVCVNLGEIRSVLLGIFGQKWVLLVLRESVSMFCLSPFPALQTKHVFYYFYYLSSGGRRFLKQTEHATNYSCLVLITHLSYNSQKLDLLVKTLWSSCRFVSTCRRFFLTYIGAWANKDKHVRMNALSVDKRVLTWSGEATMCLSQK